MKFDANSTSVTTHFGVGHASVITSARFSPDQKHIVTASGAGNIFIWKCPIDFSKKSEENVVEEKKEEKKDEKKEAKDETKDEVIQDLPSARSDKSDKPKPTCRCPCANKTPDSGKESNISKGGDGDKNPDAKPSPKDKKPSPKGKN